MDASQLKHTAEWGPHEEEILRLYYDEGLELSQVSHHMNQRYGLQKSNRQYKRLFKRSGRKKNLTSGAWAQIGRVVKARQGQGKESEALHGGKRILPERVGREIKRYEKYRCRRTRPLSRITIRTPPASPQPMLLSSQSDTDRVRGIELHELCSEPQEGNPDILSYSSDLSADWGDSIDLPPEFLSEEDEGDLEVLDRKIKKRLRNGFVITNYDISSDGTMLRYSHRDDGNDFILHPKLRTRYSIQIPNHPNHSWMWESLVSILADLSYTIEVKQLAWFPSTSKLSSCSRTVLIRLAISCIINTYRGSSFYLEAPLQSLRIWILWERPQHLIWSLLSMDLIKLPHLQDFAKALATLVATRRSDHLAWGEIPLRDSVFVCKILQRLEPDQHTAGYASDLLRRMPSWPSAELLCQLFDLGASIDGYQEEPFSLEGIGVTSLSPDVLTLLLNHGLDAQLVLQEFVRLYALEDLRGNSLVKLNKWKITKEALLKVLLSQGADPNVTFEDTFPLTYAEFEAMRNPKIGKLLLPHIQDATSLETTRIFLNFHENLPLRDPSKLSKELALLGAAKFHQEHAIKKLLALSTSPNVPMVLPLSSEPTFDYCRNNSRLYALNPSVTHDQSRRMETGRIELPIAYSIRQCNIELTLLMLESNSLFPHYLLENILLCALISLSHVTMSSLGCYEVKGTIRDITDHTLESFMVFLALLCPALCRSTLIPSIGSKLLCLAIFQEDICTITALYDAGVALNGLIVFEWPRKHFYDSFFQSYTLTRTYLTLALEVSSFSVVRHLWGLGARFFHSQPHSGAWELSSLLAMSSQRHLSRADALDKFDFLMEKSACVDSCWAFDGPTGKTPLQSLCSCESLSDSSIGNAHEIIDRLIFDDASINANGSTYAPPLHLAASRGHWNIIRHLVVRGADVNLICANNLKLTDFPREHDDLRTPLTLACAPDACVMKDTRLVWHDEAECGCMERIRAVDFLLDHGAEVNLVPEGESGLTALCAACRSGCLGLVRLLVERGADVNPKCSTGTPLEFASFCSSHQYYIPDFSIKWRYLHENPYIGIVRFLVEHGADANASSQGSRSTVLSRAICSRDVELVQILLDAGSDVNLQAPASGETALHAAALTGNIEVVQMLIERGADVNALDLYGETALCNAAGFGDPAITSLLLANAAHINLRGKESSATPLIIAVESQNLANASILLENGADVDARMVDNGSNLHALDFAVWSRSFDMTALLLEYNADVNAVVEMKTPIEIVERTRVIEHAAGDGHYDIVQLLINAGADRTEFHKAIVIAKRSGHTHIADLLERNRHGAHDRVAEILGDEIGTDIVAWSN